MADLVVDASALVDLLIGGATGLAVERRIVGHRLHAPAHVDAEVLSALGRLHRAGTLSAERVEAMVAHLANSPVRRHPVAPMLVGAWSRRHQLRLADALYVELAVSRGDPLITTDRRLRPVPAVEVVDSSDGMAPPTLGA